MDDVGWVCSVCASRNRASLLVCSMCESDQLGQSRRPGSNSHGSSSRIGRNSIGEQTRLSLSVCSLPRLVAGAISGALTGMFAIVGAFADAITGALSGQATDNEFLQGDDLAAVAGAVLSVEVSEASQSYLYSEHSDARSSSLSMREFIEDLLNGRFVQEQVVPAVLAAHQWQVNIAEMSYEELSEMFGPGEIASKGVSEASVKKLPWHTITQENGMDVSGETICCTICLQELQLEETARSLPLCRHTFHVSCVDKWLIRHGSCPICRQEI